MLVRFYPIFICFFYREAVILHSISEPETLLLLRYFRQLLENFCKVTKIIRDLQIKYAKSYEISIKTNNINLKTHNYEPSF